MEKTKLKTLEDLDQYTYVINSEDIDFIEQLQIVRLDVKDIGSVKVIELRQEAIKWYKHFRKHLMSKPGDLVNHLGITMVCEFIKDFFNIKEEDLK